MGPLGFAPRPPTPHAGILLGWTMAPQHCDEKQDYKSGGTAAFYNLNLAKSLSFFPVFIIKQQSRMRIGKCDVFFFHDYVINALSNIALYL